MPRINPNVYDIATAVDGQNIRDHVNTIVTAIDDLDANGTFHRAHAGADITSGTLNSAVTVSPDAIVIAPVNAPDAWKKRATFICDGTADQEQWFDAWALAGIPAVPDGVVHVCTRPVVIAPGDLLISAPLTLTDAWGPELRGSGMLQTFIRPQTGATMALAAMMKFDACNFANIGHFTLGPSFGDQTIATFTDALAFERTVGRPNSSHMSAITRVFIEPTLRWTNGIAVGRQSGTQDLTDVRIEQCYVAGNYINTAVTPEATYWQRAFSWGSGSYANILVHSADTLVAAGCRYGLYVNATDVQVKNVNFDSNGDDLWLAVANRPFSLEGFRSESAKHFLTTVGNFTVPATVDIRNGAISIDQLDADNKVIEIKQNGTIALTNVSIYQGWDGIKTPKINVSNNGTGTTTLVLDGVQSVSALSSLVDTSFSPNYVAVDVRGYLQVAIDGAPVPAGSTAGNLVQTVTADYTVKPVDGTIIANSAAAARTITLQLAAGIIGRAVTVRREGANGVTVSRAGTDTINGSTGVALGSDNESMTFLATAAGKWSVVASNGTVSAGGSSGVTVQDEGTALATLATTVNYTGAGVTASGTGATKTVTIPGGGGTAYAAGTDGDVLAWKQASTTYVPKRVVGGAPGTGLQRGLNLTGAEWQHFTMGGTHNLDYFFPSLADFTFWAGQGLTLIRLPFGWERMQIALNGALDPYETALLDASMDAAQSAGARVLLDCHAYGRRAVETQGGSTDTFDTVAGAWINGTVSGGRYLTNQNLFYTSIRANSPLIPGSLGATGYRVTLDMGITAVNNYQKLELRSYYANDDNYYWLQLNQFDGVWRVGKKVNGVVTTFTSAAMTITTGTLYTVEIDVNQAVANNVRFKISGAVVHTAATDAGITRGQVGVWTMGCKAAIDNATIAVGASTSGYTQLLKIVGDGTLTTAHLQDLWTKMATRYKDHPALWGYDIMNEPHDMPVPTTPTTYNTTSTVTLMNRAGLAGVRSVDTTHAVIVELDTWGQINNFTNNYGSAPTPWVPDTLGGGNVHYSAHYYQDAGHAGSYVGANATWDVAFRTRISTDVTPMLQWGQTNNLPIFMGEFGVLNDTTTSANEWRIDLETLYDLFDQYGAHGTYWAAGRALTASTSLTPAETNGVADYTAPAKLNTAIVLSHLGAAGGFITVPAKGALPVGSATGVLGSVPVGSNNAILTADSTNPMGVKWAATRGVFARDIVNTSAASFTLNDSHYFINADATGGQRDIYLPSPSASKGYEYRARKAAGANNVRFMDGTTVIATATAIGESVWVMSDGTQWLWL